MRPDEMAGLIVRIGSKIGEPKCGERRKMVVCVVFACTVEPRVMALAAGLSDTHNAVWKEAYAG